MKVACRALFLILIVASPAFSLLRQNIGDEPNYKRVNGFSGYLTLDDYPHNRVQRWLDPVETESLSVMPTMRRGRTMGAFVELMACKQGARRVCNVLVDYTIFKPDGNIVATREVRQREILWKKQTPRRSHPFGLAHMYFRLGKNDPAGEYKVKAKVSDLNADISLEIELNFYLK